MTETIPAETPIACTLGADEVQARLQRIAALGRRYLVNQRSDGGQLHLNYERAAATELREIVELERKCCGFLRFALHETSLGVELVVTAPANAGEFAPLLFEHFSASIPALAASCGSACGCSGSAA